KRWMRYHRLVARAQEGAHQELDELVRAVAEHDLIWHDAVLLGQRLSEVEAAAVRVPVERIQRVDDGLLDAVGRRQRAFVRRALDRVVYHELPLELLDRLARLVRSDAQNVFVRERLPLRWHALSLEGRVRPEDLQEQGPLLDLAQHRRHGRRGAVALEIHEDHILPGALLGRTRLDFREVDPEPRQGLEDAIEAARLVAHGEQDRRLVSSSRAAGGGAGAEKAGGVVRLVADRGSEDGSLVEPARQIGGNRGDRGVGGGRLGGGGGGERLLGRDVRQVLGEPHAALRESLGVREHAL